jgi:pyruvate formate lyase activating enzyme
MRDDTHGGVRAEFWHMDPDGVSQCELCPHRCRLKEGQDGLCKVRGVRDGVLWALGYGLISSAHVDPVEKKPLYHFHPGAPVFSIGGWGCNFGCVFCQNWTISQRIDWGADRLQPGEVIRQARQSGCRLIAYTYNEPLVGFEFVRDCSRLARAAGLKNVLVTNGSIHPGPAAELLPLIDAMNVDIKSMDEDFYRRRCQGALAPVLAFCGQAAAAGCHVELTALIIPTLNDSPDGIARLAAWVRDALGVNVPLHLGAYHPDYRLAVPPTSADTLAMAFEVCGRSLHYVYVGNLRLKGTQDTHCPGCGVLQIARDGYDIRVTGLKGGQCAQCGRKADVIV